MHGVQGFAQAMFMMLLDLSDATVEVGEPVFVSGQDVVDVVGDGPKRVQRGEELSERLLAGLAVQADVAGDARQDVVAGEQNALPTFEQADVAGGVTRGVQDL